MASVTEESLTVKANVLKKTGERGQYVRLLTFKPKVRISDGAPSEGEAIKQAINEAMAGKWTTVDTDRLDYAIVTTEALSAENIVVMFSFIRSGSRCPTCGALSTKPRSWCKDIDGCQKFRITPTTRRATRRRGFAEFDK